jgi:hypothetical protein
MIFIFKLMKKFLGSSCSLTDEILRETISQQLITNNQISYLCTSKI